MSLSSEAATQITRLGIKYLCPLSLCWSASKDVQFSTLLPPLTLIVLDSSPERYWKTRSNLAEGAPLEVCEVLVTECFSLDYYFNYYFSKLSDLLLLFYQVWRIYVDVQPHGAYGSQKTTLYSQPSPSTFSSLIKECTFIYVFCMNMCMYVSICVPCHA